MKNKLILMGLLTLAILTQSCQDWLDEQPINTVTEDQAWQNGSDAEGAVAAGYAIFRRALAGLTKEDTPSTTRNGAWGDHYFWGDARSGDWITPNNDGDWEACMENHLIERSQLEPMTNWRLFYRVIEQCNLVLEEVPNITEDLTDERKAELLADARFLRAMAHFYAARIWGDIPINLTPRNVEPLGRESIDSVMTLVVQEAETAAADLPWSNDGTIKESMSRGTRGAALALEAHAYMWLGEYQKASDALQKIIDSNVFKLASVDDFRDLFDEGESEEVVFEIFYDADLGEYSGYYGHIMTYYLTNPYTSRSNLSLAVPKSKILEIYPDYETDGSDKRVAAFFQSIDFSVSSSELRPIFSDPLQNGEREIMFAKFRKTKDMSYNQMDAPIPVFRYGGLLLLKAEADARLNNLSECLVNLNKIRARAGVPEYTKEDQSMLIEQVLEERRRELIGEYHRVYDLVRLGRLHEFNENISATDEAQGAGFYPVADEAFENNPNMTQTYYWQFNQ
ncbi:RagB/SusD family nutrient uptake outer membrane protein [Mangrovibacterium diazotrophicum]|uniref:Putative outer membrane starch-binding protein n=1 Tax=Mangrovibacterium diazotrophicum TaxID=1261403 RepID=A0A419VYF8_9BACT|nr:RagB/SusD family nutrient uptake outer membrane protein [Mangrovibacterium diazotrophicum]RKD88261.1 putative outer membrane starch-binding protein [Mangrovibacterium diazotrophicum]